MACHDRPACTLQLMHTVLQCCSDTGTILQAPDCRCVPCVARRERATVLIANMKASVVGIYFMHRDWDQSENFPASLGNDRSAWAIKAKVSYLACGREHAAVIGRG